MFADLHNHLLPGVDDGSTSLEETVRCLRAFREGGVAELVVTPHFVIYPERGGDGGCAQRMATLESAYAATTEAAAARSDLPRLHFGQEIFAPAAEYVRPLLADGRIGVAGTRFLLVEFGFQLGDRHMEVIELVRAAGREIVVAHPERYSYPRFTDPLETVRRWRDLGAFLQVNLGSLTGYYANSNAEARRLGWRLVEDGLVHLLASDDHADNRPQRHHSTLFEEIAARGGESQARLLLSHNPLRVLRDELPEAVAPLPQLAEAAAA